MTKLPDFFRDQSGQLSVEGIALPVLAEKYGTPLYVYSAEAFLAPLRRLQKGLASLEATVCFAVKANSNLSILRTLVEAGAGMDLVSGLELRRALHVGCPEGRIVFSGVGKTREEIEVALQHPIHSFNVESVAELRAIHDAASRLGKRARVALRFNPDVNPKTHPYISTGLKRNKFGLDRREILEALDTLEGLPTIDLEGISVHIGSQILALKPFEDAFVKLGEVAQLIEKRLGRRLSFLDLGGGLGVRYRNEKPPRIEDYCKLIVRLFGKKGRFPGYRILIEPGRQIAANSGLLLTRVIYRKRRAAKDFLVVDAAMNDLMRPSLYESYHEALPVERKRRQGRTRKTDLVGPVCETADCLASDRKFPEAVGEGDLIAFLSAGAYGMSMSSQYNSRPRAAEVLIQGGESRLIRRRETYDDLIRSEIL